MIPSGVQRIINAYVQYYTIKPSRIGLIPVLFIYLMQKRSINRIERALNSAKTI